MQEQRRWPTRYEVRVRTLKGQVRRYHVITWLGVEKAIALAARKDSGRSGDDPLYDVEARHVGPAPRNPDGTVAIGTDLADRMEF